MNKVLDKFFTKADNGTVRLYDYDVTHLWLAGLVYAHIGYWVENLFRLASKGVLDSRNQPCTSCEWASFTHTLSTLSAGWMANSATTTACRPRC